MICHTPHQSLKQGNCLMKIDLCQIPNWKSKLNMIFFFPFQLFCFLGQRHRWYRFQYLTILQFFFSIVLKYCGSFCLLWISFIVCVLCGIHCCFFAQRNIVFFSGIVSRAMFAPESLLISDREEVEMCREGNERRISSSSSSRISFFAESLKSQRFLQGKIMKWLHNTQIRERGGVWQTYYIYHMAIINGACTFLWVMPNREIACSKIYWLIVEIYFSSADLRA